MRFLLLVVFVGVVALRIFETEAFATALHKRWAIDFPTVALDEDSNTITVDYGISDELTSNNVRTEILTEDCGGAEITQGILSDTVDPTSRAHEFRLDIHPLVINETISTIFSSEEQTNATMKFCLKYALWTGDEEDDSAIEINYLYNLLTVYLKYDGDFALDGFWVTEYIPNDDDVDDDKKEKLEKEKHILQCYLCHPVTHVPTAPPPGGFGKGDVVSICSEASQSVLDDNMILKGVDYFVWKRTQIWGGIPIITEQWAVKDGVPDALSTYHCPPNALLCTFTTMLNAEFFTSAGSVEGIGSTTLEFGNMGRRKLEFRIRGFAPTLPSEEPEARELQGPGGPNMAMVLPIRGPEIRPRLNGPIQKDTILGLSPWLLWLLVALVFMVVFGLSVGLYWTEWRRETQRKVERSRSGSKAERKSGSKSGSKSKRTSERC